MIVRGPRPTESFTIVSNAIVTDSRLTWKARGLLIYLLSKPDNWRTNAEQLAKAGPDGRDAVRSALRELEELGYMRRRRSQDARGRWTTSSIVYDSPRRRPVDNLLLTGRDVHRPRTENPTSVDPSS